MELTPLIEALSRPSAYPGLDAGEPIEVHQTHISVVFLAGPHAYKVKKPVVFGFLDFRTLDARRRDCEQEVRLNRRLAPRTYHGVVPITADGSGVRVDGPGEVVEWAVAMERLPEAAMLGSRLRRGEVGQAQVEALARRLADFHAEAENGPQIAEFGRFSVVSHNAIENFEQAESHVGTTLSRVVFDRLRALTDRSLCQLRPLIDDRARRSIPRDGHGDLRLDHIYLFPDREKPDDLVIIDCIEFAERFRYADPVADMAFLVMDFIRHGRRDLGRHFAGAYFHESGDTDGPALLPFYTAYRAAVRGKVDGMLATESEVPPQDRAEALVRARSYWLVALGELEVPCHRPCVVLISGLPGVGKSTLARKLAEHAGFSIVRSDLVRKELANLSGDESGPSPFGEGIYTPEWTHRTYDECLRRMAVHLFEGERVLVDASFGNEEHRRLFLNTAACWGVPAVLLICEAEPEVIRSRLSNRRGDASDADWAIHQQAAARWEPPGSLTQRSVCRVNTGGGAEESLAMALRILRDFGLADAEGTVRDAGPV